MRRFIVKHIEVEGEPIIKDGQAPFFCIDEELVPEGYQLEIVENSPKLKTIYVIKEEVRKR